MKIVKTKKRVKNPVTGTYYNIYERKAESGDTPIQGMWHRMKDKEER